MSERGRVAGGAVVGAVLGAGAAYLLLTDRGRLALRRLGPSLDDLLQSFQDVRVILEKAGDAIREGRSLTRELKSTTADLRSQARSRA